MRFGPRFCSKTSMPPSSPAGVTRLPARTALASPRPSWRMREWCEALQERETLYAKDSKTDSHRNRTTANFWRDQIRKAMTDPLSLFPVGNGFQESARPPLCRSRRRRLERSAGQFACSPGAIAPFHFNDGFDQVLGRSFEALLPTRVF